MVILQTPYKIYFFKLDFWKDHQVMDFVLHPGESLSFHLDSPVTEHLKSKGFIFDTSGNYIPSPTRSLKGTYDSSEHLVPHPGNRKQCTSVKTSAPIKIPRRRLHSEGSIPEDDSGVSLSYTSRRRLFSEGSVPDSGPSSPIQLRKQERFSASVSNVIHEDGESFDCSNGGLFVFDEVSSRAPRNPCRRSLERLSLNNAINNMDCSFPNSPLAVNEGISSVHRNRMCHPFVGTPDQLTYASTPPSHEYSSVNHSIQSFTAFPVNRRERTLTNQSLRSFGSPIEVMSPSNGLQSSTPLHHPRERTRSDASAPPMEMSFDLVQGYEFTTGLHSVCMGPPPSLSEFCIPSQFEPPPPYQVEHDKNENREDAQISSSVDQCWILPNQHYAYNPQWLQAMNISQQSTESKTRSLTEEDAIDALSKFVSGTCCYSNGVTKHMKTKQIKPSNGHQYVLETFYEERSTSWHQEPYTNQIIDGPENGPAPEAWVISVNQPKMFQQKDCFVEVPHTASVKDCSTCHAKGNTPCTSCRGTGNVNCSICDGIGFIHRYEVSRMDSGKSYRSCQNCNSGRSNCHSCTGNGRSTCTLCQGNGRVKVYIRLSVKWKVLKMQQILERTKLPNKCIGEVSGVIVFHDQNDRVYPLIDFPEDEINFYSRNIINSHDKQLKHARVVMQRHYVREVPVSEVRSQWKRQEFTYWVYGNENHVFCPDYPAKCNLFCSVL